MVKIWGRPVWRRGVTGVALLLAAALPAHAAPPHVVASIKPIQSLVAGVMAGLGEPALIVQGSASPHTYTLRPSDARRLETADLIFWVGPTMEGFLPKALRTLAKKAQVVELDKVADMKLFQARVGGAWEPDDGEPPHQGSALEQDGHLWLDPDNARLIVRTAVLKLSQLDPIHVKQYVENGAAVEKRVEALDAELSGELKPLHGKPFIVFHDAYQYLEHRYNLKAVGSIAVSPDQPPGAHRIAEIRDRLVQARVVCVFAEPQFQPRLIDNLIAGTAAKTGVLDPEGTSLPAGPDLYFTVMRNIGQALAKCLG